MRLIFVDHQTLAKIAGGQPDIFNEIPEKGADLRAFRDSIRQAVEALNEKHRQVIEMYFFENLNIGQIAQETAIKPSLVLKLLREATLTLKHSLADIVRNRWPDRFGGLGRCQVCEHPKRKIIEIIANSKKRGESWGSLNKRLAKIAGTTFNPPSILINHMKYHTRG